jgi:hypothetical protein
VILIRAYEKVGKRSNKIDKNSFGALAYKPEQEI